MGYGALGYAATAARCGAVAVVVVRRRVVRARGRGGCAVRCGRRRWVALARLGRAFRNLRRRRGGRGLGGRRGRRGMLRRRARVGARVAGGVVFGGGGRRAVRVVGRRRRQVVGARARIRCRSAVRMGRRLRRRGVAGSVGVWRGGTVG
ncbi:hypothetical protein FCH28_02875 [Streptomyces piniterrae]|uniref:Uncharacterized protein n=1 Tax=Streptomyces piniterrae TaxID=2571125 RepID=A0A4U0P8N5_9ACTN|nr:hypothetical protein FCH28_02875 [Streptomyces piniterrae]